MHIRSRGKFKVGHKGKSGRTGSMESKKRQAAQQDKKKPKQRRTK